MRQQKLWAASLTSLLLLLQIWGCTPGGNPTGITDQPGGVANSVPVGGQSAIIPTASPKASEENCFFLCGEYDLDFYLNSEFNCIMIPVVSRTPIDTSAVKITLPLDIDYEVYFNEILLTGDYAQYFDYYLYQCYRGLDWGKVAELFDAAREASTALEGSKDADRAALQQTVDDYWAYTDQYSQDYDSLTQEQYPKFYAYEVLINFYYDYDNPQDDSFTYIDVSWPGVSFRAECGEVRFHKENAYDDNAEKVGGLHQLTGGFRDAASFPYGPGTTTTLVGYLETENEVTLTRGYFSGYTPEISRIQVNMDSLEQNPDGTPVRSMDYLWDGQTPLTVEGGLTIQLNATFTDQRLQAMVPEGKLYFHLEYEYQGERATLVKELGLHRNANFYELAAIYLDGIDVRSYYEQFFYPYLAESGLKNLPDPA